MNLCSQPVELVGFVQAVAAISEIISGILSAFKNRCGIQSLWLPSPLRLN